MERRLLVRELKGYRLVEEWKEGRKGIVIIISEQRISRLFREFLIGSSSSLKLIGIFDFLIYFFLAACCFPSLRVLAGIGREPFRDQGRWCEFLFFFFYCFHHQLQTASNTLD